GRWKILDNLRRSLVAPSLMALLVCGWTVLPGSPAAWTLASIAVMGLPLLRPLFRLARGPTAAPVRVFLRMTGEELGTALAQILITITFLAFHAYRMVHAILLTLVRLLFTQRGLLEWVTAARSARLVREYGPAMFFVEMAVSPAWAALVSVMVLSARRG